MAGQPPIATPGDCLHYPLLHDTDRADWPLWLAAHGAPEGSAEAGQGLALVPQLYAHEEIAAGRLVQVLDLPWPARFAYYLVARPDAATRPAVQAFIAGICEEAQATGAGG